MVIDHRYLDHQARSNRSLSLLVGIATTAFEQDALRPCLFGAPGVVSLWLLCNDTGDTVPLSTIDTILLIEELIYKVN